MRAILISLVCSIPMAAVPPKPATELCQGQCDHKCEEGHGHDPNRLPCSYESFELNTKAGRRYVECRFRGSILDYPGKRKYFCCGRERHYHTVDGGAMPPPEGGEF